MFKTGVLNSNVKSGVLCLKLECVLILGEQELP